MKIVINIENGGLKKNRELSGMSQKELADQTGISIRTIQEYERGSRDLNGAKFLTLLKFCNVLGCSLDALLTDSETLEEWDEYQDR